MRNFLVALTLVLSVGAAEAKSAWAGPGWYQIADTIVGPFVWAGPFADKESCVASLPPNEEEADYNCEYLSAQPEWDDGL